MMQKHPKFQLQVLKCVPHQLKNQVQSPQASVELKLLSWIVTGKRRLADSEKQPALAEESLTLPNEVRVRNSY